MSAHYENLVQILATFQQRNLNEKKNYNAIDLNIFTNRSLVPIFGNV